MAENIKDTPLTQKEIDQLDSIEEELKQEAQVANVKMDLDDLVEKIVKYCEVQAGINLHPYQKEFAKAIVWSLVTNAGEEITALFSRQSGRLTYFSYYLDRKYEKYLESCRLYSETV